MLLYKIIGSGFIVFVVFYQRYPHGACFLVHFAGREKLSDLYRIAVALHGTGGA